MVGSLQDALLAVAESDEGPVAAIVHAHGVGGLFVGEPPVGYLENETGR